MRKTTVVLAIFFLAGAGGDAMAQGSGSSRAAQGSGSSRAVQGGSSPSNRGNPSNPSARRPPTTAQFAASFWGFLNNPKTPYRKWGSPGRKKRQGVHTGPSGQLATPHSDVGQTYLNSIVNRDLKGVPLNSVFTREEYSADGQTLENITVMYRSKGVDPANGDWYWMMYNPNGSLVKMRTNQGELEIAGRVQHCIDCHRKAGGNDFVFMNDGPLNVRPSAGAPRAAPAGSGSSR